VNGIEVRARDRSGTRAPQRRSPERYEHGDARERPRRGERRGIAAERSRRPRERRPESEPDVEEGGERAERRTAPPLLDPVDDEQREGGVEEREA
jgi:hypothetical protein